MNTNRPIIIWALLALAINGIAAFLYSFAIAEDTTNLWALLATTYIYCLGLTQTGIVFSAIMRIAKSEWGRHFSRLGEILTISFIPAAFVLFLIIYFGGTEHLFYWARHEEGAEAAHISPWLGKGLFFWRTIISMALFYAMSYVYFRTCRLEEIRGRDVEKTLNLMAGFVMFFYVATNTNTAWDFGMMIIRHWESTVFPAYFWVGNLFAGTAFVFLMGVCFIPRAPHGVDAGAPGKEMDKSLLDSVGKILIGFCMLWTYMFWSQHIVLWYGDLPNLTAPLIKQREGNFAPVFYLMLLTVFIIPFFALLFRRIKLDTLSLSTVALIIMIGVWTNRYLMVIPVFADGEESVFATYTGVSLLFSGLAFVILSFIAFKALFPGVNIVPAPLPEENH